MWSGQVHLVLMLAAAREFMRSADGVGDARLAFLFVERGAGLEAYISANQNVRLSDVAVYFGGELVSPNLAHASIAGATGVDAERILAEMHAKMKGTVGLYKSS